MPARLYIEAANANIAGHAAAALLPPADGEELEPELTVIYTPNLKAEGFPDDRLIAVDLEQGVTRVFNSDYFGESKKGGLRMWNKLVYDRGGIPLHAGCKIIPTERGKRVGLIVGLSGTGKTTTTFTRQNGSLPVQDDFVAWMPDGRVYATENGCFAKTFGLNPEDEPTIYGAVTQPDSYLENVSQHGDEVDFYDTNYTSNGRATFPFSVIEAASADEIDEAHFLLILNQNENIVPAVAKLEGPQAAAFFMLGETHRHERRRRRRGRQVPAGAGDEPVLPDAARPAGQPLPGAARGAPARGLRAEHRPRRRARGRRALAQGAIKHSSAIVKGIAEGTIEWERDPDFGYLVAASVPGIDERRDPAAAAALRAAGPRGGVPRPRRALQGRASRVPARLPEPLATRSSQPLRRETARRRAVAESRARRRIPRREGEIDRFLESPALSEATRRAYGVDVREFARLARAARHAPRGR